MLARTLHLMIIGVLATTVALRIGGGKLQPLLQEMKNNLRTSKLQPLLLLEMKNNLRTKRYA